MSLKLFQEVCKNSAHAELNNSVNRWPVVGTRFLTVEVAGGEGSSIRGKVDKNWRQYEFMFTFMWKQTLRVDICIDAHCLSWVSAHTSISFPCLFKELKEVTAGSSAHP